LSTIVFERLRRQPEGVEQETNEILSQEISLCSMLKTPNKTPKESDKKTLTNRIEIIPTKYEANGRRMGSNRY
jgi:galactose-1-phosphate uridylyltransferase